MRQIHIFVIVAILLASHKIMAQGDVKTGWNFGALPSVAFDADLGFQYGALTNIFYYGDGSTYPEYMHSIYAESAYTTKKNGLFRLDFDSRSLIPDHQLTIDIAYIPDAMCDFAGFNGYQSVYNAEWSDDESADYRSRAFYKYRRNMFRATADIQGSLSDLVKWNIGCGAFIFDVSDVNIGKLNRGQSDDKKLPDIDGLFEKYRQWGLLKPNETDGGFFPYIHAGLSYDSRNFSSAPSSGIWADAFLTYTASFGDRSNFNSLKLNANFRQYISIGTPRLVFAYRVGAQFSLAGDTPFYMSGYHNVLQLKRVLYESLGGSSSMRGVMRCRVLSRGFALANIEMRIKLVNFDVGSQHFYVAVNPLVDVGMVLQPFDIDENKVREAVASTGDNVDDYFKFDKSDIYKPHASGGMGLKVAMNENFIFSVDWATPFNEQDNGKKSNLYVKMGYLF